MKLGRIVSGLTALLFLAGCASSPATRYFTLSEGLNGVVPQGVTPSIVITQVTLPELIDRSQLVVRRSDNQVSIDEQKRWAEPLRRAIPRVLADELGRQLDSNRVFSLPIDGQGFDADFRLLLDVQQLDVVESQSVQTDIVWRLLPRQGGGIVGRSALREMIGSGEVEAQVAAQQNLLKAVAADIARQVRLVMGRKP